MGGRDREKERKGWRQRELKEEIGRKRAKARDKRNGRMR